MKEIFCTRENRGLDMKLIQIGILILFTNALVHGQSLFGTVKDQDKVPIIGANIINQSQDEHTHTNQDGFYEFQNINLGDTIHISYIGYESKNIIIQSLENKLNIILNESPISLDEVVISPKIDVLNIISDIDLQTAPVNSTQDILRKMPGLFIGQHAGGGKAEQIFLRGFDIDHGTDISITVDGLPVNMVSHAHGQGYSDLHFIIPETVNNIEFGKGPYYGDKGNFNTAGYVNFKTKRNLEHNTIRFESGMFGSQRLLAMLNILESDKNDSYVALEYLSTDGPFESPQNFNRTNLFAKHSGSISDTDNIGITVSHFTSKWDASGQIPQRAVDSGMINRFGAIDDTEGGYTNRTNFHLSHDKVIDKQSYIKNTIFYSQYNFELFSNFTFFLEDEINGDQIKQKENRHIFGLTSEYTQAFSNSNLIGEWQAGITLRYDQSLGNELSNTLNRNEVLNFIQLGDVYEANFGAFISSNFTFNKLTFNPSIRLDYFEFQYIDDLQVIYNPVSLSKSIVSPKLNILYQHSKDLQLYAKAGKGFHSNDTRVVLQENIEDIIPAAYGFDFGAIWKPLPQVFINAAYWYLFLEQEFVYVGDAGIVEPSGRTRRSGIELSLRYQPYQWLFWNFDANYTYARSIDEMEGEDYIPLAPDFTLMSGLNLVHRSGIYGSLNVRYIKDRPANENFTITAEGYEVIDLNVGYSRKKVSFGLQIQNLLNTEWNETQFATESRLQNEPSAVEEIHFTPGTPFFLKGIIEYKF